MEWPVCQRQGAALAAEVPGQVKGQHPVQVHPKVQGGGQGLRFRWGPVGKRVLLWE